ncbi:MAG: phage/plasmid primase, P4 family [Bradyrhizobium sp.]
MDYADYGEIADLVEGSDVSSAPRSAPGAPPTPPFGSEPSDETVAECAALDKSDTDNAIRLIKYFPDQLLVMQAAGVDGGDKLVWSGKHWDIDGGEAGFILRAQQVGNYIQREAILASATDEEKQRIDAAVTIADEMYELKGIVSAKRTAEQRKRLDVISSVFKAGKKAREKVAARAERHIDFGVQSKDSGRIAGMIKQAVVRLRKPIEEFNASALSVATLTHTLVFHQEGDLDCPDPNVKRYTAWVEARKGHRQDDYITALVPVSYNKKVKAPKFEAWIEQMMPDAETRRTLQQFCGCSILGIPLQYFMFHYGEGANGKSVFLEMLVRLLGKSFAVGLPTESIVGGGERAGGSASPDIIRLFGKRMVRVLELPEGKPLQSELIKKLTGGEEIPVRTLFKGYIDFMPRAKPHMSGNGLPKILDTSNGIWRRMLFVKWPIMIAEEDRRDPEVMVSEFLAEASGVFNWLCEGACDFLRGGSIYIAPKVRADVQAYRREMDRVLQFVEDCLEKSPGDEIQGAVLFAEFKNWCAANNKNEISLTRFGRDIKRHVESESKRTVRYLNVKLRDDRVKATEAQLAAAEERRKSTKDDDAVL